MVDRLLGKKVIGIKQSIKAINKGEGKVLYIAEDADEKLLRPLVEIASKNGLEIKPVETMRELGKICGIDVKSSATLIL